MVNPFVNHGVWASVRTAKEAKLDASRGRRPRVTPTVAMVVALIMGGLSGCSGPRRVSEDDGLLTVSPPEGPQPAAMVSFPVELDSAGCWRAVGSGETILWPPGARWTDATRSAVDVVGTVVRSGELTRWGRRPITREDLWLTESRCLPPKREVNGYLAL